MLLYATEDDFGLPETAFNVCTFWLIEALHATGRDADARLLFEEMLTRRSVAGLLSEDIDPASGELRSEEHTSELQSLMRISYAVFCLKKKKNKYTMINISMKDKKQKTIQEKTKWSTTHR